MSCVQKYYAFTSSKLVTRCSDLCPCEEKPSGPPPAQQVNNCYFFLSLFTVINSIIALFCQWRIASFPCPPDRNCLAAHCQQLTELSHLQNYQQRPTHLIYIIYIVDTLWSSPPPLPHLHTHIHATKFEKLFAANAWISNLLLLARRAMVTEYVHVHFPSNGHICQKEIISTYK